MGNVCGDGAAVSVLQGALSPTLSVPGDDAPSPGHRVTNMAWRSCSVLLRLTGEDALRSSARGGRVSVQQRCLFRKVTRKPEQKGEEHNLKEPPPAEAPPTRRSSPSQPEQRPPPSPPRDFGLLLKPLVFTVGTSSSSSQTSPSSTQTSSSSSETSSSSQTSSSSSHTNSSPSQTNSSSSQTSSSSGHRLAPPPHRLAPPQTSSSSSQTSSSSSQTNSSSGHRLAPPQTSPSSSQTNSSSQTSSSSSQTSSSSSQTSSSSSQTSSSSGHRLTPPQFTGCSFGAAAIWQYESLKFRVQSYFDQVRADWLEKLRPQKRGNVRKEINQWWNSLSEGQRTVTGIIAANAIVFCCWRVPSLQRSMLKHFTADPASKTLCAPMLLSTFSHFSFFHLAANMYVLWSFSSSAVSMLGREQFLALYLSAATGRFGPSLGASGAIMTVLAAVCTKMPEAQLAIIFLPMFSFSAANALKAIVAMDTAGVVLGWRYFDHAAHLGGALFGIWYIMFGHELIWKNREPFVKLWHELRTGGGRGGGGGEGGAV
ncbi:hypothetical protein KUCAC02_034738 [Chaenocephalus aceratus]|nr:hypothetical protein KUCAC02_034738 [Chaenocephalus aceratus]